MDNQLALLTLFRFDPGSGFAASRAARVLKFPQGNERMQKISSSIHHGAMAYLRRQYRILICFFAGMFVILFAMAAFGYLTWFVPFAFITGGFFFRSFRLCGNADRYQSQCPDGSCLPAGAEQRTERSFFRRVCYGIYSSGTGASGYFYLVSAAPPGIQTSH